MEQNFLKVLGKGHFMMKWKTVSIDKFTPNLNLWAAQDLDQDEKQRIMPINCIDTQKIIWKFVAFSWFNWMVQDLLSYS